MLSRKYYRMIAEILRQTEMPWNVRQELTERFAEELKRDNSKFQRDLFFSAVLEKL